MGKSKQRKNVYVYIHFAKKNFRYASVEAVDDNDNRFLFTLDGNDHEEYLCSAKKMCEQFEEFCKNTCGLYDARYCEIWTLDYFSPLPDDFTYESLFDKSTINTKEYKRNLDIYTAYITYNLELIIGKCDYACGQYLLTQYGIKNSHIKDPESFDCFAKRRLTESSAVGVKSVVADYNKRIDKNIFTPDELANVKAYMLKNINVVFEFFDRHTVITREKRIIYFALYEAAMRLYEFDNTAFQEIIHNLLDKLHENVGRANSAVYSFIFNFFEVFYDKYYGKPFEGALSDYALPADFCSAADKLRLQKMFYREEGSSSDGLWADIISDEYIFNAVNKRSELQKPVPAHNFLTNDVCMDIVIALQDFDEFWRDYCHLTNVDGQDRYPNKIDKIELIYHNLYNSARGYITKILICKYYLKLLKSNATFFLDEYWQRKLFNSEL